MHVDLCPMVLMLTLWLILYLSIQGQRNKIHISQDTADILIGAGKAHWVFQREDKINAKGKGEMQTFWVKVEGASTNSQKSGSSSQDRDVQEPQAELPVRKPVSEATLTSAKLERLVKWNTEVMSKLLKEVIERRQLSGATKSPAFGLELLENEASGRQTNVLDEVQEIIELPKFEAHVAKSSEKVVLSEVVVEQLHEYVRTIAEMYNMVREGSLSSAVYREGPILFLKRENSFSHTYSILLFVRKTQQNPFHNFEHASHVTMSVVKLLSRIIAPDIEHGDDESNMASTLHDHTYGITSDPLTQFSVVLSALIHDVDHPGTHTLPCVHCFAL